jgi:hypothetical protein
MEEQARHQYVVAEPFRLRPEPVGEEADASQHDAERDQQDDRQKGEDHVGAHERLCTPPPTPSENFEYSIDR